MLFMSCYGWFCLYVGLYYRCPSSTALSFLQFSGGSTLSAEQEAGFDWPRYECCE